MRHLVLIDTASRLATRIINGRRTLVSMAIEPAVSPEQIEAFRVADPGELAFQRIVGELNVALNNNI